MGVMPKTKRKTVMPITRHILKGLLSNLLKLFLCDFQISHVLSSSYGIIILILILFQVHHKEIKSSKNKLKDRKLRQTITRVNMTSVLGLIRRSSLSFVEVLPEHNSLGSQMYRDNV